MAKITKAEALRLLKRAVERRGEDHIYTPPEVNGILQDCKYFHPSNGRPGCIVGNIVANEFGVKYKDARDWNDYDIAGLLLGLGIDFTPGGFEALREAQFWQDRGYTWGVAYRMAKKAKVTPNVREFLADYGWMCG